MLYPIELHKSTKTNSCEAWRAVPPGAVVTQSPFPPEIVWDTLSKSVQKLDADWVFLNMLLASVCKRREWCRRIWAENPSSGELKLWVMTNEIGQELSECVDGQGKNLTRTHGLLLLSDCQRKNNELPRAEIGEALECLSDSRFPVHSLDHSFWNKLVVIGISMTFRAWIKLFLPQI